MAQARTQRPINPPAASGAALTLAAAQAPAKLDAQAEADLDRNVDDLSEGQTPMVPDLPFVADLDLIGFEYGTWDTKTGRKCTGARFTFEVQESNVQELATGVQRTYIFWSKHPSVPDFVIERHAVERARFFDVCAPGEKPSQVAQRWGDETLAGSLRVPLRMVRTRKGTARSGRAIFNDEFVLRAQ